MFIVVDKIACPVSYEGFPVCPTIHIPSDTYTILEKNFKKKKPTFQLAEKRFQFASYSEIHP